ncbi:hypothetical protein [Variovorax sp. Sphag1AA]|uniref:hypothetical protein n=1 Tax=Variovorax sp. Sphag1AA TaxID=2587027 RepID=UPI00161E7023|nr:hypothetical protein [Variovorax sp. Sphag1AA]MBB3178417.1 hypothetical protein [Variovorax sp. Sphag1AA]
MTGYLDRLATRLVEPRSHIRPRPLSRFEAVDAPAAISEDIGTKDADTSLAPSERAQPSRVAVDRRDTVHDAPSKTPPPAKFIETPEEEPHRAPVANVPRSMPSALDAPTTETQQGRAPSRHAPFVPAPETREAPRLQSSASRSAMPTGTTTLAEPSPTAKEPVGPPAIEERISPWRAPLEHPAEPAIEARATTQAPLPATTPAPRQRAKPEAQVDDSPSVVQVTIGRLEVRAPEPPRRPSAKPTRAAPRMSLQDYLQRRSEGRAR